MFVRRLQYLTSNSPRFYAETPFHKEKLNIYNILRACRLIVLYFPIRTWQPKVTEVEPWLKKVFVKRNVGSKEVWYDQNKATYTEQNYKIIRFKNKEIVKKPTHQKWIAEKHFTFEQRKVRSAIFLDVAQTLDKGWTMVCFANWGHNSQ